MQDTFTAAKN